MLKRLLHSALIIAALAPGYRSVQFAGLAAGGPQIRLNGEVENNNGRLCLSLSNNSDQSLEAIAVIALGNDTDQTEIGQFTFHLDARSDGYFRIKSIAASGEFYRLRILGQDGGLLLYRTAPIKLTSDGSPAIEVALTPPTGKSAGINTNIAAKVPAAQPPGPEPPAAQPEVDTQDVSVKAQLLGSPADPDSFAVFFELRSRRPIREANIAITAGKFSESKPVSIEPASNIQFQLPGKESEAGEYNRVDYRLTDKDGRQLAGGTLELDQLMANDEITVLDVRTHRPSYTLGETAKLTVLLEGRSQTGYRLEVFVRDYNGMKVFVDQRISDGQTALTPQEFIFILPTGVQKLLVFDYKVYNTESGALFDSGEFEIPIEDMSS